MVYFLFLATIFINMALGICHKKSKFILVTSFFSISVMMCGYRRPFYGDLDNYSFMYKGQMDTSIGLKAIFNFFKKNGFEFLTVHYILIILFLAICFYIIVKYSIDWHFAIALFSSYYIVITSDQIKNHAAFIFLALGIISIINDKKKWALIFILLASTIHYSYFIYLLIFVFVDEKFKFFQKPIIIISFIVSLLSIFHISDVIILFVPKIIGLVNSSLGDYAASKTDFYFSRRTNSGFLLCFLFQFANYYTITNFRNKILEGNEYTERNIKAINVIVNTNLLGFVLFPLFIYSQQWYRIIREFLPFNYSVFAATFYLTRDNKDYQAKIAILSLFNVVIWLIGDLFIKSSPEGVIIPFFENNIFLK